MDQDALLAQLLGMGFGIEEIERCQVAMATSSRPYSLQEATEWLLQNQRGRASSSTGRTNTLVLTPPTVRDSKEDFQHPVSSSKDFSSSSSSQQQPLKSRLYLNEESVKEKERYEAKERGEVVKRQKEMKAADVKARQQVLKDIADDRKARQAKSPTKTSAPDISQSMPQPTAEKHVTKPSSPGPSDICRVQVRLPNGRVVRHNFTPSSSLDDVATFVMEGEPHFSSVILVQPFPHHEFTPQETQMSLLALGLYPSASLVVSKQSVGGASVSMETSSSHSARPAPSPPVHGGSKQVSFRRDQITAASSHIQGTSHGADSGGHVLGYGDGTAGRGVLPFSTPASSNDDRGKPLRHDDVAVSMENELMEVEESEQDRQPADRENAHSDDSDSGSDDDDNDPRNFNHPMFPPPRGNVGLPPGFGPRGRAPQRPPWFQGLGGRGDDDMFEGQGHRLGGKEAPPLVGDVLITDQRMQISARTAAIKRAIDTHPSQATPTHHHLVVPSLETLCTKLLVSSSRGRDFPSCASLTPMVAQRLLASLMHEKRLNSLVLACFHGCPLQIIKLDNYCYATNELLSGFRYFQSVRELSLGSCSLITDKAVIDLFPYLSGLTLLNLNGCRQLNETICRAIRCCKSLEVLQLSHVKISDRGMQHLLHQPLLQLRELDLSNTLITSRTLALLPNGAPQLKILNIESTKVDNFTSLSTLPSLHTLNVAHCQSASVAMETLCGCSQLCSLSLAGVTMDTNSLQKLSNLKLHLLKLPDRNNFFDDSMEIVSGFPLTSLDLMDYCHVTDVGISCLSSMRNLTHLSLSRTKLTDGGMPFIQGLTGLRELSLDNTIITDEGIKYIADLTGLDVLSLSDTRVTSQFIVGGVLDQLSMLTRLNLSRTAVCDIGVMRLRLPSLVMLNLDWTSVTELSSLLYLRENGCPVLETLRNRNIGQPLPRQPFAVN